MCSKPFGPHTSGTRASVGVMLGSATSCGRAPIRSPCWTGRWSRSHHRSSISAGWCSSPSTSSAPPSVEASRASPTSSPGRLRWHATSAPRTRAWSTSTGTSATPRCEKRSCHCARWDRGALRRVHRARRPRRAHPRPGLRHRAHRRTRAQLIHREDPWNTRSVNSSPADEQFCHQIAETFATVGTSDPAWTEKVCAMAAARDGSLQLGFGLGKYTNRNVIDAYAGISRGVEQMTVRASRRLSPEPERTSSDRSATRSIEPLRTVRFVLEPNDVQPIAFDWRSKPCFPRDRGPHPHPHRLPGVGRPRALPPDRRVLRVGRDRR